MLTPDDLKSLEETFSRATERQLRPLVEIQRDFGAAQRELSARMGAVESRLTALAEVTATGLRTVLERPDSLETRVARLEEQ